MKLQLNTMPTPKTRGPYRKRCANCGDLHSPRWRVPVCEGCITTPPAWMIASAEEAAFA